MVAYLSRCLLFLIAALAWPGMANAQTVIRLVHEQPVNHFMHKAVEMIAKEVSEKTNGSVKIEIYPAGQLVKDADFPREVMSGTADAGLSASLYWAGVMPIVGIFDVPFLVQTHEEAQKVLASDVGRQLLAGLEKFQAVGLGYFNYGFGNWGTTKRELLKPDDFKSLKIRSNNDMGAQLLKAFGASSVFMTGSELFLAMQQGTIDGAHIGLSSTVSRKTYEVVKNVTVDNHNLVVFFVVVRKAVYDKLTPQEQSVLREAVRKAEAWVAEVSKKEDDDAIVELRKHGVRVTVLAPEDARVWAKAAQPVRDTWLKRMGKSGEELLVSVEKTLGRAH